MSETATAPSPEDVARETETGLAKRIELVEQENRKLRQQNRWVLIGMAALFSLGVAALLFGTVGGEVVADTIQARRFVLSDPGGSPRGEWSTREDGSAELVLRDRDGHAKVSLAMRSDGSTGISFLDARGRPRAVLGVLDDQTANLVFADPVGRTRSVLGYTETGAVTLIFADQTGKTRAGFGVDPQGNPDFTLFEERQVESAPEQTDSVATADPAEAPPTPLEPAGADAQPRAQTRR